MSKMELPLPCSIVFDLGHFFFPAFRREMKHGFFLGLEPMWASRRELHCGLCWAHQLTLWALGSVGLHKHMS